MRHLILIHIVQEVVDTVRLYREGDIESEDEFFDRVKLEALKLVHPDKDGFDPAVDLTVILAVDGVGEAHEIWHYVPGGKDEKHGEEEAQA